ncbi:hypothetical protein FQA47_011446 [Oryzias melastigma]|uniref:Uncharacterized protein n=1 Tax=Oryzias melastigma TaxID=30732 RepID=A0A834FH69_ORYME|nr:hypothetical protein FQA47_011446 [Oryzias melastigma]
MKNRGEKKAGQLWGSSDSRRRGCSEGGSAHETIRWGAVRLELHERDSACLCFGFFAFQATLKDMQSMEKYV